MTSYILPWFVSFKPQFGHKNVGCVCLRIHGRYEYLKSDTLPLVYPYSVNFWGTQIPTSPPTLLTFIPTPDLSCSFASSHKTNKHQEKITMRASKCRKARAGICKLY